MTANETHTVIPHPATLQPGQAKRPSKSPKRFGEEPTDMPKPLDGHQYSPYEVVTILGSLGEGAEA